MSTMSLDARTTTFSDLVEVNPRRGAVGLRSDDYVSFIPMQDVLEGGAWSERQCRRYREVSFGFPSFVEGDVLFAKITPCMENGKGCHAVGLINGIGFGSTEFHVLRPKASAVGRFVFHLSQSSSVRKKAEAFMVGSAGQQRVQPDFFDHFKVPDLSRKDQYRIAEVLDAIDKAIEDVDQLVAKLKRLRQGLIHDLLTRGLDADGTLRDPERDPEHFKDSPVGRVPKVWAVRPLNSLAEVRSGIAKNGNRALGRSRVVPYLRVANVQDGYLDLSDMAEILVGIEDVERYALCDGDVLMNEGGDRDKLGRGAVWKGQLADCVHQNHVFAVRCGPELVPEFLDAWTGYSTARCYFQVAGKQSTNLASINKTAIEGLPVVKPSPVEQAAITAAIEAWDSCLRREAEVLSKLRALKQGLMEDLLTGRVRVSAAGAGAP
jgi:type I restriction enzyme S subunit